MHHKDISIAALAAGHWKSTGKSPEATLNVTLNESIKRDGEYSPFVRVGKGICRLRRAEGIAPVTVVEEEPEAKGETISFLDAAERILRAPIKTG